MPGSKNPAPAGTIQNGIGISGGTPCLRLTQFSQGEAAQCEKLEAEQEGTPNNWLAWFGGKAWEYDTLTGQYYMHLFAKEQPDLNWRNPAVREAQLDIFRFWLERGVDGFRLDVFNAYFKHPDLPDNPPKWGLRGYDRQRHIHDIDQPEMLPFLNELRHLLDSYPDRYVVGEPFLPTTQKAVSYCGPDMLHAAFSFDFTTDNSALAEVFQIRTWNPAWIMQKVRRREEVFNVAGIWPTMVLSNHDMPRAASRYTRGESDAQARIAMTLLLTLRGTPFMYYGEEIGMRNIHLRRHEILDPPGKKYWPFYKGRDGCRAPMQWDDGAYAGFSSVKPWLPINPDYSPAMLPPKRRIRIRSSTLPRNCSACANRSLPCGMGTSFRWKRSLAC